MRTSSQKSLGPAMTSLWSDATQQRRTGHLTYPALLRSPNCQPLHIPFPVPLATTEMSHMLCHPCKDIYQVSHLLPCHLETQVSCHSGRLQTGSISYLETMKPFDVCCCRGRRPLLSTTCGEQAQSTPRGSWLWCLGAVRTAPSLSILSILGASCVVSCVTCMAPLEQGIITQAAEGVQGFKPCPSSSRAFLRPVGLGTSPSHHDQHSCVWCPQHLAFDGSKQIPSPSLLGPAQTLVSW